MRRSRVLLCDNLYRAGGLSWRDPHTHEAQISDVIDSPYKDAFKDFWSTPIHFQTREFGAKPKLGEPVPSRDASSMLVLGKNNYITKEQLDDGDEDYKVLMLYRESKQRFVKDQFIIPGCPVHLDDKNTDWLPVLERHGVTPDKIPPDFPLRMAAIRGLLKDTSILVIPPEGGQLAELEGPGQVTSPWWSTVIKDPGAMRSIMDILEMPYESALKSLLPFRRVLTPTTETFRFDNTAFIVPFGKIPEVRYCIPTVQEKLIWCSPTEALKRFNAGVMEMATPTAYLMSELQREIRRHDDIVKKIEWNDAPKPILPEVVHNDGTKMATILFPHDVHHSAREAELAGSSTQIEGSDKKEPEPDQLCRFHYMRDEPYGVRAVFFNRPVEDGDDLTPLTPTPDHVLTRDFQGETEAAALLPEGERAKRGQAVLPDSAFNDSDAESIAVESVTGSALRSSRMSPHQQVLKMKMESQVKIDIRKELGTAEDSGLLTKSTNLGEDITARANVNPSDKDSGRDWATVETVDGVPDK